jgi:Legionella pneumophila major outer membrane protein precursor
MGARGRMFLAGTTLGAAVLLMTPCGVQAQPLPPAPVPVDAGPPPPPVLGRPAPFPGPTAPPPPPPSPFARPDPGRNGWVDAPSGAEGPFFNVELDFLKPTVKSRLSGVVVFPDGSTDTVQAPQADLDWSVAPRFEMGYRFADGFGDLSVGYRFLVSEARTDIPTAFGDSQLRSRLDLNQIDLDYSSARFSPAPFWDLKWRVGARLADVYFDSRQNVGGFAALQSSNNFFGAGPHFGMDAERRFGLVPGLSAFGRLDGAVLVGRVHQRFEEDLAVGDGTFFPGESTQQRTQSVPVLTLQDGLSYTPKKMEFVHFTTGYQFERWWNIGRINGSTGELTDQGVFLRAEFDY